MTYIFGLSGIDQLGTLSKESKELIKRNGSVIKQTLKRAERLNVPGFVTQNRKNLFTFSEMVRQYNTGISEDEIKAWVWYRRSIGIPMHGWEKYYIDGGGSESNLLIAIVETVIKDNHFRDLKTMPAGAVLGKKLSKSHQYDTITYQFFRDNEGIKMVNAKHAKEGGVLKTDQKKLDALVRSSALFYLNGDLLPYPVYAYGNMYDRTLDLEKDKPYIIQTYGIEAYARHEQIIRDNKPRALTVTNPDPKERPKISALSKFACNKEKGVDVSVTELREETGIIFKDKVSLQGAFTKWLYKLDKSDFEESSAYNISKYYLNGDNMPRDSTPEAKAELRRTTRNEGERLFDRFLNEALRFEDQQRMDVIWNRLYNGVASVAYHKIPIGFECSARFQGFDFELRPAQREGIAFLELVGSGIVAFDVGVGKTITAIAELANSISSGKCKRPIVIVPNATYNNWIKELVGVSDKSGNFVEGLLSGTGIVVNEWYNMGTDVLKRIKLDQQVPEKSVTLVTFEGFKKIGFGRSVADDLFVELSNILSQSESFNERDKEIEYQKYREVVGVGLRDTVADIDVLGFDYMVIDEAHNCKNVFSAVKKDKSGRKRFGMSGATSDMGIKAFFLTNYLQRKFGRNVMLLTATPFNNSPLEIYSMLSLAAYHGLRQMNIENINDFFEQFVLETTEDVVTYNDQIQQKDVVKSFNNRLLLQRLIYNHINYKTGEEANVKRPKKINLPRVNDSKDGKTYRLAPKEQILTYLKMTHRQRQNQTEIISYMNEIAHDRGAIKNGDLLRAMNQSMNNALHPVLYDNIPPENYKDFVEDSPKIKYAVECIRSVREYHRQRNEPVSGQVLYCNRGKDYFHFIKEYLENEVGYQKGVRWNGMKVDEVEIIDSSVSTTKKENIKNAFLEGVCKVIIGTATIREGINLQRKGTVLYNLFPDWNPTDLRQLEGRIWRQKNEFGFVRIVLPLVQDSMDVFVFQKLDEKTHRINDIWFKGDRGNVLDLESLDPEEVKFALLTDIEAIAANIIKKELVLQERRIAAIEENIKTLNEYNRWRGSYQSYRERLINQVRYFFNHFSNEQHIKYKPTADELKALEKEQREKIKKDIEFFDEVTRFFETIPTDKELLAMGRRFVRLFSAFSSSDLNLFAEALSVVKKAEQTLLASKGFTANDDIGKVIESYKSDLDQARKQLEYLNGDEYKAKILREVKIKKDEMAIAGKSTEERVEEFARLNYLLSYKFADIPSDGSIPAKERAPEEKQPANAPDEDLALRIRIAKVKFRLLKLKF